MNGTSAAKVAGISYRQLDHWIRKGYIRGGNPGSGNQREIAEDEMGVLRHMSTLVHCGFVPERAARMAREIVEGAA